MPLVDDAEEEEVVAPTKRPGKHKPLPPDLPRTEVIHELTGVLVAVNMPS